MDADHGDRGQHPSAHHEHAGWRVRSLFRAHSHDHAEQLDPVLAHSSEGIRVTRLSLLVLGATALVQLGIVFASGSVALLADMVHNVADALTSIPLWIAFVLGRRPPTPTFPYGYRRAEDLAGLVIVAAIAATALIVGWESVQRLLDPTVPKHLGWVLLAGLIGIIGNEFAAVMRIRTGHRIGSAALVADGYHARTDTLASFGVVIAVGATWLGYPLVDAAVGLLITGMICWVLIRTARQVLRRLMDGVEPEISDHLKASATGVEGVQGVDWARARWSGHRLVAELAITVDRDLTVAQGHTIAETVHHELLHHLPHLDRLTVHVNPCQHDGGDPHHLIRHHPQASSG